MLAISDKDSATIVGTDAKRASELRFLIRAESIDGSDVSQTLNSGAEKHRGLGYGNIKIDKTDEKKK